MKILEIVIHDIKRREKVFWNTFHIPISSKLCNTGDHSQWKKNCKTKTTINTLKYIED